MRDIKFRAWDNKRKRWAEWVEVYSDGTFNIGYLDDDGLHHWLDDVGSINFDSDKECILMQFTGLCDKNGTEIYEGDIVKQDRFDDLNDGYIADVRWDGLGFDLFPYGSDHSCILAFRRDVEVIGNIYENPELLRKNLR